MQKLTSGLASQGTAQWEAIFAAAIAIFKTQSIRKILAFIESQTR